MNKLIILTLLCATGISASAQDWSKVFAKYNTKKGVESVYISPEMFKLIGKLPEVEVLDKDINLTSAIVSLNGLYVLEAESSKTSKDLLSDVRSFAKSKNLKLILNGKEDDEHSEIYALIEGEIIHCLLFISTEDDEREADVIFIEGDLSLSNFKKLINKNKKK